MSGGIHISEVAGIVEEGLRRRSIVSIGLALVEAVGALSSLNRASYSSFVV